MKKQWLIIFLAVFFILASSGLTLNAQKADDTAVCPVTGKEIKKADAPAQYEYQGKIYYFCCNGCKAKFIENPEKYLKNHEKCSEHTAHHVSMVDPRCGMKVLPCEAVAKTVHEDITYYFCSAECKEEFEKNPEKYVKNTPHAVCPVSGESVIITDDTLSFEYEGKTYYFCCSSCRDKFAKDPKKYISDK